MRGSQQAFPKYESYPVHQLLEAYVEGAKRLEASISDLDQESLLARPRGDETWSVQEIVLHLVDSEAQALLRVRKILAESGVALPGYDQDAWTSQLDHQNAGREERLLALRLFGELRRAVTPHFTAENLHGVKYGLHPEYGQVNLLNMLQLYADHSERHISQILAIRQLLGRPLKMPLLLPERLY